MLSIPNKGGFIRSEAKIPYSKGRPHPGTGMG
jgi:hypothetical protein